MPRYRRRLPAMEGPTSRIMQIEREGDERYIPDPTPGPASMFGSGQLIKHIRTADLSGSFRSPILLDLRGSEGRPEAITIMASYAENPSVFSPVPQFRVKVEPGALRPFEVDLLQGTMFSLIAPAVKVSIVADPETSLGVCNIVVAAAPGMRASAYPPTRTMYSTGIGVAPAGVSSEIEIPPYARGVTPQIVVTTAGANVADYVVRQKTGAGGTVMSEHPFISTGYMSGPRIPLLNDATHIDLENVDAANTLRARWIFDLAF